VVALVEMRDITKTFPGVLANQAVNFTAEAGEIHAVVGENGAGKSTLMNVLYGLYQPDSGEILLRGKPVVISSPHVAIENRIGMVHQHFMLIPSFSVAENIVFGRFPCKHGHFDSSKAADQVKDLSARYGMPIDPCAKVMDLPVGTMQRIEILKALYRGAEILILDEPTAVLTPQDTEELFVVLRALAAEGKTVILITHKLREVIAISNRVTVMRAGRNVGVVRTQDTSEHELARLMVGREVFLQIDREPAKAGEEVLTARNLCANNAHGLQALDNVCLSVRAGEILGIAGVEGNGQTELVEVVTGMRPIESGSICIGGVDVTRTGVRGRRELGISHIPEDRMRLGVSSDDSVEDNAIVASYYRPPLSWSGIFLRARQIADYTRGLMSKYDVRASGNETRVGTLSGGNMQKLVLAREFAQKPRLLIAAQPTRGVDVGGSEFIRKQLVQMRDQGCAILLVSADLDEILSLSDRIFVMYEGKVVAEVAQAEATEHRLGVLMTGGVWHGAGCEQGSEAA
jgi:ABC-type uncharacterized transport system ATPase subunit